MSIVSTVVIPGNAQVDGRRYVTERHTDHVGVVHVREYLSAIGADTAAIAAAYVVVLVPRLEVEEIERLLAVDAAPPSLVHITKTQFAAYFRERYRSMTREELARMATWIINRISAGWVTDAQCQTAFGLTGPGWTTLKAKMTTLRTNWLAVLAAQGE
jgi:hypothetical protein